MSLQKGIDHKKEYRKNFFGSKKNDRSCRNHGSCSWCEKDRTFFDKKNRENSKSDLEDYVNSCYCFIEE